MESTAADFPRSIHPTPARDSELRVANGRGLLSWVDIKPEFERCLRCEQADGVCSVGSCVERRSPGQEVSIASLQVWVEETGRLGVNGKGIQLVGERFSWPVEIAEAVVIDTTGAALRENDMRVLDGEFSGKEELSAR